MEIILHTADISKNMKSLNSALSSNVNAVELDFVMTKDGIPVWTHDIFPTQLHNYESSKNNLSHISEEISKGTPFTQ